MIRFLGLLAFFGLAVGLALLAVDDRAHIGLVALLALLGSIVMFFRPALGMMLFVSSFFVTYNRFVSTDGFLTPNNLLGGFFALLLLFKVHHEKDAWFLRDRILQVFALVIIWMVVTSRIAEATFRTPIPELDVTSQMMKMLVTRFVFLVLFVNFIRTFKEARLVLLMTVGLIIVTAASGLQSSIDAVDQANLRASAQAGIEAAGNPNRLAFFCVAAMAIIWYYRRAVRGRVIAVLLTLLLPMLGVTTLMAGSRSGLLNLGVLFLLISIEGRFSAKRQLQMVIVGALIGTLAAYLLTSYHSQRLLNIIPGASIQTQGSWSTEKRVNKLEHGLAMVADHPGMGIGVGNFMWMELEYSQGADWGPPHNSYLWATTEGGIPALLLYLLLYAVTFKTLLGVERRATDLETRMMARGLRTAFLLFFVFSFFADFWLHIFTYLMIGLVVILRRLQVQEHERLAVAARLAQRVPDTSAALPAGATPA